MFIPKQRPTLEYFLTRKNYTSTKSTTFFVLNKKSCAVSSNSMAYPCHHKIIQPQGVGGKHSWCLGEEQFPAATVQCSISNCVVFMCTPTQLQCRKQKQNKTKEDFLTAKISLKKKKSKTSP